MRSRATRRLKTATAQSLFFFFQAEDGIRDYKVTGVQTCALPIFWLGSTYGVVVSWSDTQVVANVASGSKSGVAQVLQGGVWSNTVNLTVSTPNKIGRASCRERV